MGKLALLGGAKVRPDPLPLYNTIGEEEKAAVMEVLIAAFCQASLLSQIENILVENGLRLLKEPL